MNFARLRKIKLKKMGKCEEENNIRDKGGKRKLDTTLSLHLNRPIRPFESIRKRKKYRQAD